MPVGLHVVRWEQLPARVWEFVTGGWGLPPPCVAPVVSLAGSVPSGVSGHAREGKEWIETASGFQDAQD